MPRRLPIWAPFRFASRPPVARMHRPEHRSGRWERFEIVPGGIVEQRNPARVSPAAFATGAADQALAPKSHRRLSVTARLIHGTDRRSRLVSPWNEHGRKARDTGQTSSQPPRGSHPPWPGRLLLRISQGEEHEHNDTARRFKIRLPCHDNVGAVWKGLEFFRYRVIVFSAHNYMMAPCCLHKKLHVVRQLPWQIIVPAYDTVPG